MSDFGVGILLAPRKHFELVVSVALDPGGARVVGRRCPICPAGGVSVVVADLARILLVCAWVGVVWRSCPICPPRRERDGEQSGAEQGEHFGGKVHHVPFRDKVAVYQMVSCVGSNVEFASSGMLE
jgi:hypothetical protein